jgi:dUTPase
MLSANAVIYPEIQPNSQVKKNLASIVQNLLSTYDKVMVLQLFVDSDDEELRNRYLEHAQTHNEKITQTTSHIDAGFDLFTPGANYQSDTNSNEKISDSILFYGPGWENVSPVNKLDFKVIASARMYTETGKEFNTGYYMYPRSSLSKTQLRLANATGIIDAGYRGHLMGMFDVVNIQPDAPENPFDYCGKKFDRYLQICAPGLVPIVVEIVNSKEELGEKTVRGDGGFGSTGR